MGKDMENVNMKEKEGLIRDRFQVENKKLWTKVVLNDSKKKKKKKTLGKNSIKKFKKKKKKKKK